MILTIILFKQLVNTNAAETLARSVVNNQVSPALTGNFDYLRLRMVLFLVFYPDLLHNLTSFNNRQLYSVE